MKGSTAFVFTAIAALGAFAAGAHAHANPAPAATASVGSLRFIYSGTLHRRYFSSCSYAVTGDRSEACVRGVVVASYPLRSSPELGAKGASFRSGGVLFELYRAPRRKPVATRALPPSLSLSDFHPARKGMHTNGEKRELFFRAKGANYWAIAWVGRQASKSNRDDLSYLIGSIQIK